MAARNDPFAAFNFLVEIQGIAKANFSEVSGLAVEIAAIEYREGGDAPRTVRKLVGLAKYTNITLKRGFTSDLSLWNWVKGVLDGKAVRAGVTITLLNDQRQPVGVRGDAQDPQQVAAFGDGQVRQRFLQEQDRGLGHQGPRHG